MKPHLPKAPVIISGLLFFYLFFAQLYSAFVFSVDDAFISLRYAEHLAQGQGLTWNIGAAPVEGYSNFLYVLLASIFIKINLPPLISLKLFSCLSLAASVFVLYKISLLHLERNLAFIPSLLMLSYYGEIFWTVSGLETAFYQLLVLTTVYQLFQGMKTKEGSAFLLAGIINGLAGLTRPEAPMFMMIFSPCVLYILRNDSLIVNKHQAYKFLGQYWLGFSLLFAPYFFWRLNYFGLIFANSIYCKSYFPAGFGELDLEYLTLAIPLLCFALPRLRKKQATDLLLLLPSIAYLVVLVSANPVVAIFNRLFLPAYPLLLPLTVSGIHLIFTTPKNPFSDTQAYWLTVLFSLLVAVLIIPSYLSLKPYQQLAQSTFKATEKRMAMALWIKQRLQADDKIIIGDCGIIPYTLKHSTIIDSSCLNSREMTHPPISLSNSKFMDWALRQKAAFIVVLTEVVAGKPQRWDFENQLLTNSALLKKYDLVKTFTFEGTPTDYYYYHIYQIKSESKIYHKNS